MRNQLKRDNKSRGHGSTKQEKRFHDRKSNKLFIVKIIDFILDLHISCIPLKLLYSKFCAWEFDTSHLFYK
jgi:hypothetical protein